MKEPKETHLLKIENVKAKIVNNIKSANILKSLTILLENAQLFHLKEEEIYLILSNYVKSEKQFHQNIITKNEFDQTYAKTIKNIQLIINSNHIDDILTSQKKQIKAPIQYFFWAIILLFSLGLIIIGKNYIFSNDKFNAHKMNSYLQSLTDQNYHFEKKEKLIKEILSTTTDDIIVQLKGKNGSVIHEYEFEHFLKEASLGGFDNIYIEKIKNNILTVRYNL